MRIAIWNHYGDAYNWSETELDVTKGDTKRYDKLQNYLPTFILFQSDRKNCDGDCEAMIH